MFIRRNYTMYDFSITIHSHPAIFYEQNAFKRIMLGKCSLKNLLNFNQGGLAPWPYMHSYDWLISPQNKNL